MERHFPKCLICGSNGGYYVSGVFRNYAQCQSCKAKWKLRRSGGALVSLMLHELPKNGQGLYLVNVWGVPLYYALGKEYPVITWSKITLGDEIDWESLRKSIASDVATSVILGKGERMLVSWNGFKINKEARTVSGQTGNVIVPEEGILLLTNRRILWMEKRVKTKGFLFTSAETLLLVTHEIRLEEVKGITATTGDSQDWASPSDVNIVNGKGVHRFRLYYAFSELFRPTVGSAISMRQDEIEQEKKRDKVQVMLDFSFLKKYMEDGGLAMRTLKCPECGASLKFPDAGSQTVCGHCGANIYASDIFKRIRELIG